MSKYKVLFDVNDKEHPFVMDIISLRGSADFKKVETIDFNGCYVDCGNIFANHPKLVSMVGGHLSDVGGMGLSNMALLEEFKCDMSEQYDFRQLFQGCVALREVEITIRNMERYGDTFYGCSSLERVRVICNVEGMSYVDKNMFGLGNSSCVFEYSMDGGVTWIREKD